MVVACSTEVTQIASAWHQFYNENLLKSFIMTTHLPLHMHLYYTQDHTTARLNSATIAAPFYSR